MRSQRCFESRRNRLCKLQLQLRRFDDAQFSFKRNLLKTGSTQRAWGALEFCTSAHSILGAATLQPDAAELTQSMLALSSAFGLAASSEKIGGLDPFLETETAEINAAARIADALGQQSARPLRRLGRALSAVVWQVQAQSTLSSRSNWSVRQ